MPVKRKQLSISQAWREVARLWNGPRDGRTIAGLCWTIERMLGDQISLGSYYEMIDVIRELRDMSDAEEQHGVFLWIAGHNRHERAMLAQLLAYDAEQGGA